MREKKTTGGQIRLPGHPPVRCRAVDSVAALPVGRNRFRRDRLLGVRPEHHGRCAPEEVTSRPIAPDCG